jgi:hypothetical protein
LGIENEKHLIENLVMQIEIISQMGYARGGGGELKDRSSKRWASITA